jgi:phosphatidylinositol alpha-mannosyltransferase
MTPGTVRPMRVALTHVYCWPEVLRGGERFLHELSGALARRGHDVTILSSASQPGTAVEEERSEGPPAEGHAAESGVTRGHGVRVVRLRSPRGSGLAQEKRFGRAVLVPLLRGRFDVVHSLGIYDSCASIVAARVHRRRRTVYTHLGIPLRSYYEQQPDFAYHRFVARYIDVFGCMSRHAAAMLEEGFGRTAALTPGGVHLHRFTMSRRRAERPTLLYSGAITEPRKHVDDLLEAVAILSRDLPDVRLRLVGQGDPSALLAAAPPAARERTEVLPPVTSGLSDLYGDAWATVLPSVNEAFGIVLVESLACGTPIVVCDHSAPPELVQPGTGAIARPRDPASLAEACAQALARSREPGIEARCRAAAEPYDWDTRIAPAVEALYAPPA